MLRSTRPSAGTPTRKSHASRTPCKHNFWCLHEAREACNLRAAVDRAQRYGRIDCVPPRRLPNRTRSH
eukprot:3724822-Lingulodinium_polyedra.AAC.1